MSEPWHGINDPGYYFKPKPAPADNTRVAYKTDPVAEPKKEPPPTEVKLSNGKFLPPNGGLNFNDKCKVQVKVEYLRETSLKKITFSLFCTYNGKTEAMKPDKEGFEKDGIAEAEFELFYPEDYKLGNKADFYFKASHRRGEKIIDSEKLTLPIQTKTGWIPFITFSNEYSKVNAYNLSLLANLAYEEKDNIKNYFEVLKNHSGRVFQSQGIVASPFLVEVDAASCFKILDENEDVFDIKETDTQGFFASNEKQVIISVRGTTSRKDWGNNLEAHHVAYSFGPGHVHEGFYKAFLSIKEKVSAYYDDNGQNKNVIVTGHSLGGAVATLIAAYLKADKKTNKIMLYTFGSPRVGDRVFADHFSKADSFPCFRIVNNNDIVPKVPLPYMDLRPELLLNSLGQPAILPFVLFNPLDDPFTHIGKFVHMKRMSGKETFLSKLEERAFYIVLSQSVVTFSGKLTLDAILSVKGSIEDHDMTLCYCPILWNNMMKSINSYLASNSDAVKNLEKDIQSVEKEITDLEGGKLSLKSQALEQSKEHYLAVNYDRMIEGRKKYLNEYQNRLAHYKQIESNKQNFLQELTRSPDNMEIETELKYQKQHS
jgi:hypothetical protein